VPSELPEVSSDSTTRADPAGQARRGRGTPSARVVLPTCAEPRSTPAISEVRFWFNHETGVDAIVKMIFKRLVWRFDPESRRVVAGWLSAARDDAALGFSVDSSALYELADALEGADPSEARGVIERSGLPPITKREILKLAERLPERV
jgi:hypothetical protein